MAVATALEAPPPIACRTLKSMSWCMFTAKAQRALAMAYTVRPKMRIGLRPYLSLKGPQTRVARLKKTKNRIRVRFVWYSGT